jgi:alanyl-tRNA synthetase
LLYQLIPVIAKQFTYVFPELKQQAEFVTRVVREEEEAFMRTLAKGINYFEEHISDLDSRVISGAFAFTLFDTYGFPIDLTLLMAKEKDFDVDMEDFQRSLSEQKKRSRAATAIDTEDWIVVNNTDRSKERNNISWCLKQLRFMLKAVDR